MYGTDSKPIKINDIASLFQGSFCPTLADKPKLFFIQADRGGDEDKGVPVQKDAKDDPKDDPLRHSLPSEADFLFGYSTPPGNVSWRSPRYGSWYISKLCEAFVDNSPLADLLSMLTIVNHKVSESYTTQGFKQCPAPVTLLRKQVWFFQDEHQLYVDKSEQQMALQDKEEVINQLTLQYEQQLHLLRQVKTEFGSEKERLQQQIQDYEQMLQQNIEQIEKLRRENQQGPALIGPVGEKYPMSKTLHGIAVIINNFEFHSTVPGEDPLPERRGSHIDEENLRVTWEFLRYDVRIFRNLTTGELTRQLMQIALQNHEKYDSFVCCILSHGYLDSVYGTDSKPVKINDIASLFKGQFCPTLADKPKLFFMQTDRGDDEDKGIPVQKDAKDDPDDALCHSLPSEADFLFGYATPPGNVSWRSPRYGSWYISKLCEVFVDYSPQKDLLSMLTIVNHKVSEAYTAHGFKQCPAPVTLLRKQVWFFRNPSM